MVVIRPFRPEDSETLNALFFNTVRTINLHDYSQAQVEAWAPNSDNSDLWQQRMAEINPIIAEIDGIIVGYSDLQDDGLIDHFFCHHQYQRCGVGNALMQHILSLAEQRRLPRLYSEVSMTARPFYEHFGFNVIQTQTVEIRGQELTNYVMEKTFIWE